MIDFNCDLKSRLKLQTAWLKLLLTLPNKLGFLCTTYSTDALYHRCTPSRLFLSNIFSWCLLSALHTVDLHSYSSMCDFHPSLPSLVYDTPCQVCSQPSLGSQEIMRTSGQPHLGQSARIIRSPIALEMKYIDDTTSSSQ